MVKTIFQLGFRLAISTAKSNAVLQMATQQLWFQQKVWLETSNNGALIQSRHCHSFEVWCHQTSRIWWLRVWGNSIHDAEATNSISEPLFTKRTDALPPNLVKHRSREIRCYNDRIALKIDRNLGFRAIGKVKTRISRLQDFMRFYGETSARLVNRYPVPPLSSLSFFFALH